MNGECWESEFVSSRTNLVILYWRKGSANECKARNSLEGTKAKLEACARKTRTHENSLLIPDAKEKACML